MPRRPPVSFPSSRSPPILSPSSVLHPSHPRLKSEPLPPPPPSPPHTVHCEPPLPPVGAVIPTSPLPPASVPPPAANSADRHQAPLPTTPDCLLLARSFLTDYTPSNNTRPRRALCSSAPSNRQTPPCAPPPAPPATPPAPSPLTTTAPSHPCSVNLPPTHPPPPTRPPWPPAISTELHIVTRPPPHNSTLARRD